MAEAPEIRTTNGVRSVWPLDPFSGGTWIGANDSGLAMVILNRNPRQRQSRRDRTRSRGTIIPLLLHLSSIDCALKQATDLSDDEFEPFTLLVIQGTTVAAIENLDGRYHARRSRLLRPIVFTSSSLGDHVVSAPRRALFTRMVAQNPAPLRGQAAFHRHVWKEKRELSVCMSRSDASTVSRTTLDIGRAAATIRYIPLREGAEISPRGVGAVSLVFLRLPAR